MTTRDERTRSLLQTERFLVDLVRGTPYKRVPLEVREAARRLLRHYPSPAELLMAAEAEELHPAGALRIAVLSTEELRAEIERRALAQAEAVAKMLPSNTA